MYATVQHYLAVARQTLLYVGLTSSPHTSGVGGPDGNNNVGKKCNCFNCISLLNQPQGGASYGTV